MCDIEENLHKKIEDLRSDNLAWKITSQGQVERINSLEKKINIIHGFKNKEEQV